MSTSLPHPTHPTLATTRLAPQDRDEGHVVRRRLLGCLDQVLTHRLTLVHAGAGYGKTSLLMQWFKELRRQRVATAWLTLGEDEAVPVTCLANIIASLVALGHIDFDPVSSLGRPDERIPLPAMVAAFVNLTLARQQPLVLLLDEYQRAQSSDTDALFRSLLRSLPRHVHFVVASRGPPAFDLENLRARDELIEIAAADLRFSTEEVAALLASSGALLSDTEAFRLTDRTEGWPIAVQMAKLWLRGEGQRARLVSDFSGRTMDLARYLAEQVLRALPDETQRFLLHTSVLDRVNGDLANSMTGRRDSWRMLEELHERDLFVTAEGDDRRWFRYHTLLRDFLLDRLSRHDPDAASQLHRRAADWFMVQGQLKPAVHHALASSDHELAAKLLIDAGGWRLIMDGRINLIRQGIEALPPAMVRQHLPLALAQAFLLVKAGDMTRAREYFNAVAATGREGETDDDRTARQIVRHIIEDYSDQPASLREVDRLQELRARIQRHDNVVHAVLADSLATKYYELGLFRESLECCDDAIHRYRVMGSLYGEVFLRFTQSRAYSARGRMEEAEALLRQTEKEIELNFGSGVDIGAHASIYLAELLVERGQIEEASLRLDQALPVVEQSDGWYDLYAAAYAAAAAIAWQTRGLDAALAALERARRIAGVRSIARLKIFAAAASAHYVALDGCAHDALGFESALEQAAQSEFAAQPQRLGVTIASARAMVALAQGRSEIAIQFLERLVGGVEHSGDVRTLVTVLLVLAQARMAAGRTDEAAATLDAAIHTGALTGIRRPYIEHGPGLAPLIDGVLAGDVVLPADRYRDSFLRELRRDLQRTERRRGSGRLVLTPAERNVLQELDRGFSNKEIARRLEVSPNTVKFHTRGLFSKLGAATRDEAVRIARERALLSTVPQRAEH